MSPRTHVAILVPCVCVGLVVCGGPAVVRAADLKDEDVAFFEKRVRPVLVEHCGECHGPAAKELKGNLSVGSRAALLRGGDLGPALVPGDPDKSLLVRAVTWKDDTLQMPPRKKLADAQIADLAEWVRRGAPDPRPDDPLAPPPIGTKPTAVGLEEGRRFWSYQPVRDLPPPAVKNADWPRGALDRFVLARIEAAGLTPAPDADRRTLLRRATFDLTGLPPTPAEMDAFLADASPRAFETVVDRLLDSPRYGERWGRHWLDVVRYADTCGNASDYPVPQVARYRDWVIAAFRRDLPYDRFLREQIAGDLIEGGTPEERRDRIVATGYLASARRFGGGRAGEPHLVIEDAIDNLGRGLLGTSLACARCHEHKFDPFTTGDYYGLYGIFSSTRFPFPGAEGSTKQEDFVPLATKEEIEALLRPHRERIAALEAEVKTLTTAEAEAKAAPDGPEKAPRLAAATKALADAKKRLADVQAAPPAIEDAYAVADGQPANAKIQMRGDPKRPGDEVPRHFPAVLGGQTLPAGTTSSGRLQLAEWLTDPRNPLTARVMANRIWLHHFGRGIVRTPNDFGKQGQAPTHPELLDHLAARFVEGGWSIKALHRTILSSRTWQQASTGAEASERLDPNNDLFARSARRRLDAESLRDSLLFVAGELDESPPGAHPFPPAASWKFTQHNPFVAAYETRHRSVYLMQQRIRRHPFLALFDGADPNSSTGLRQPSTTPLQALFLMNGSFAHGLAAKFAERALASAPDETARLDFAFRTALGRRPTDEERSSAAEFLFDYTDRRREAKAPPVQAEREAWSALARALLSGNEFTFVD